MVELKSIPHQENDMMLRPASCKLNYTHLILLAAFLPFAGGTAIATDYRVPNFHGETIEASWKVLKEDFKFPELPEGKSWSDGYKLFPVDKNLRFYQVLRNREGQQRVLMATIIKMVSVLEYCDECNLWYAAPVWMRTSDSRKKAVQDATGVLKEIGPQVLPTIWEAMKDDLSYDASKHHDAIAIYNETQVRVASTWEDLRQEVRKKSPEYAKKEDELFDLGANFQRQTDESSSEAKKTEAQYMLARRDIDELLKKVIEGNAELQKLDSVQKAAKDDLWKIVAKVPGDYLTAHQGNLHVAVNFRDRLRDVLISFGESSRNFLKAQAHDSNPIAQKECKDLLNRLEQKANAGKDRGEQKK